MLLARYPGARKVAIKLPPQLVWNLNHEQYQQLKFFIEFGYLIIPQVISEELVEEIKNQMNHAGDYPDSNSDRRLANKS